MRSARHVAPAGVRIIRNTHRDPKDMAACELLYLTQQEVIDCGPTLAEAIEIVEGSLLEHGLGEVENPPKPGVHPLTDTFIHAMPALLKRKRLVGLKWVGGFFENPKRGLPSISGLIVLNDHETGIPTAVMDCAYITALRTAACSAVAAKHLARRDAATLGLVGAGVQGRYNLLTLREVMPKLKTVRFVEIIPAVRERFIADMAERTHLEIVAVDSIEAAFAGADVILTATGQLHEVLFYGRWVGEGVTILPIHSAGWEAQALRDCEKFIVDDWDQFEQSTGADGKLYHPLPPLYAELGEIVAGKKPGRETDSERIVDFNYGLAIHDVAMAAAVLTRAKAKGLGTMLPQLDGEMPYV